MSEGCWFCGATGGTIRRRADGTTDYSEACQHCGGQGSCESDCEECNEGMAGEWADADLEAAKEAK